MRTGFKIFPVVLAAAAILIWTGRTVTAGEEGYAGTETCLGCHEEMAKMFAATPHAQSALGCEGCHGPGQAHADGGGDTSKIRNLAKLPASEATEVCAKCHLKGEQVHWVGSVHDSRGLTCATCHDPHPKAGEVRESLLKKPEMELCGSCHPQRKAQLYRSGHMPLREGKMQCSSCHNPHGTVNEAMLPQHSVNENCYTCHAEKRGPFLWEHPPVREDCATCHDAHGSVHDNLLKVKQPILCQQCHVASRHPTQTHVAKERFSFAHGCLNCHTMVHGSNHPSGIRLMR